MQYRFYLRTTWTDVPGVDGCAEDTPTGSISIILADSEPLINRLILGYIENNFLNNEQARSRCRASQALPAP